MDKENCIVQNGIVKNISSHTIYVSILSASACSSCHAKGLCNLSEIQEKVIEVPNYNYKVQIGDNVHLEMKQSLGIKAVLFGYFIPFILVILMLIILTSLHFSEGLSAIFSLLILVPYYSVLYINKDKLKKEFVFVIK